MRPGSLLQNPQLKLGVFPGLFAQSLKLGGVARGSGFYLSRGVIRYNAAGDEGE